MPRIHPKTWDDGVMPLEEFPEENRAAIMAAVARPTPPQRWVRFTGGQMESRAWYEWHWARGKRLRRVSGLSLVRRKIASALRQAVYERDGYTCRHCGSTQNLSLDHVHPFSLGGADTFDNLQTLCRPCNSRKGAKVSATHPHDQA